MGAFTASSLGIGNKANRLRFRSKLAAQQAAAKALRRMPPRRLKSGWDYGPPDFIGVGVQRAGTSRWYGLITAHPGALPAVNLRGRPTKEVHYLNQVSGTRGFEGYKRHFPRQCGKIIGEWTPRYMWDGYPIQLLSEMCPEAKILVILRDPMERLESAYRYSLDRGFNTTGDALSAMLHRGLYAHQLSTIVGAFDRQKVLVLQFERCRSQPLTELKKTYDFLQLDPSFVPSTVGEATNQSSLPSSASALPAPVLDYAKHLYRKDLAHLEQMLPVDFDTGLWRND